MSDIVEALIKEARYQAIGKGPKRRIRVIEIRGRKQLTGQIKSEVEMMRETVGGGVLLIHQAEK